MSTDTEVVAAVACDLCRSDSDPQWMEEVLVRGVAWRSATTWQNVCEDCRDSMFHCPECEALSDADSYIECVDRGWGDNAVCGYCFESNDGINCDNCRENFWYGGVDNYCEDCQHDGGGSLLPYDYKPYRMTFHGNGPVYFGVELEVEAEGEMSPGRGRELVGEFYGEDRFYVKHDGSLNNGMEIVSMPMTLDVWRKESDCLRQMYAALVSGGFRGWRTGTAGLHIHMSEAAFFGKDGTVNEAHLWRFLRLYYSNPLAWQRFAGRTNSHWSSFDLNTGTTTPIADTVKQRKQSGWAGARYMAWNLTNAHTYECRMFRSSINVDRVIGNIEAIHASLDYTRTLTAKDVHQGALRFDVFAHWLMKGEQYPQAARLLINSKAIGADN